MRSKVRTFSVAAAGALALLLAAFGGSAAAKDRNHDQIPDKWEKKFHLSLSVNQANKDQDKDGIDNLNEFLEGTNPKSKDSNHNGVPDGKEDSDKDGLNNKMEEVTANLPNDPDTDNNGIEDGAENAGVIAGFDQATGALTITVQGGGTVSGTVTSQTEIKCETEDQQEQDDLEMNPGPGGAVISNDGGSTGTTSGHDPSGQAQSGSNGGAVCTTADLTPGTPVHEAELQGTTFEKVELIK